MEHKNGVRSWSWSHKKINEGTVTGADKCGTSILHFSWQSCAKAPSFKLDFIRITVNGMWDAYLFREPSTYGRRTCIRTPSCNKMSKLFISRAQKLRGGEIKNNMYHICIASASACPQHRNRKLGILWQRVSIKWRIEWRSKISNCCGIAGACRCFNIFRDEEMLRHTIISQLNSSLWQIMHEAADFRFVRTKPNRNATSCKFLEPNFQHFKDSFSQF